MKYHKKIFVDTNGTYAGFRWWVRWKLAEWHLKKWLVYEGMPKNIKNFKQMEEWAKESGHYVRIV